MKGGGVGNSEVEIERERVNQDNQGREQHREGVLLKEGKEGIHGG